MTMRSTGRAQPHTVLQAIERQVSHYAQHVGQMCFMCRILRDYGNIVESLRTAFITIEFAASSSFYINTHGNAQKLYKKM